MVGGALRAPTKALLHEPIENGARGPGRRFYDDILFGSTQYRDAISAVVMHLILLALPAWPNATMR